MTQVKLAATTNGSYEAGRGYLVRAAWLVIEGLIFLNPLITSYRLKATLLRIFGASVGSGLVIKPNVHIKYPWHLQVGEDVWLGERSWIDNFVTVRLESNVCISQGAYLCTGNHDWSDPAMSLRVAPITVEAGAWVGAFARIAPGVVIGEEAVLALGSVVTCSVPRGEIWSGNPAATRRTRTFKPRTGPDL